MKHRYIILSIMVLAALSVTSCKDFLDQNPNSEATDQTTWKTEYDVNASVGACYSLIRSAFNASVTYYAYGDLTSGEFSSDASGVGYTDVLNYNWGIGIPVANTADPRLKLRLYTNFFSGIMQSNRCLYFIDKMPNSVFTGESDIEKQATKNRYLGEAYFTRAFNYFYIARVWGDVPLVTSYNDSIATTQYPREAQSVVLDQAIADAEQAITFLKYKDDSSPDKVVRADKGAAYALLAHIYAWKGDYDKCNDACDAVINSGSYSYVDSTSYLDIYKGQSTESIFEISQNKLSEGVGISTFTGIESYTLVAPYINVGNSLPLWQLDNGLVDYLFSDQSDVRYKKGFAKIDNGSGAAYECIKRTNIQNVNNSNVYQVALNNIIVFRLADIKLLKAEALASKAAPDEAGALDLINELRIIRGAEPFDNLDRYDLLYAISDEQGRELFLEGHRTFDLIRFERIIGEKQFNFISPEEFDEGKYYWPIDPGLFSTNSHIKQTPYWTGKMR